MGSYPVTSRARDRFVTERRGSRPSHDPWRYQDLVVEDERAGDGSVARVATVFLTGRECPWRCVMCDLWQHTTTTDTPAGAIPAQVVAARRTLTLQRDLVTQMKLYNAGSFFDPRAVPDDDYDRIARSLAGLGRVIVESHPALIGARLDRFLDALNEAAGRAAPAQLEVAMGLETVHPEALERLHKRMTVDDFARAARSLTERRVSVRTFLLISPPFVPAEQHRDWLLRSIDVAFTCGASVVSLVPTRSGNGAMEALAVDGDFRAARLDDIERSVESAFAAGTHRGRVFLDLWDLERFADCRACLDARRARLHAMNLAQRALPRVACSECGVDAQRA
jgi:archaeosine synthase beta-subunit